MFFLLIILFTMPLISCLSIHGFIKQLFSQFFVKGFYRNFVIVNVFCCHSLNNANATSLAFLVLSALATLYLDASSSLVNIYLYLFPWKTLWGKKSRSNWITICIKLSWSWNWSWFWVQVEFWVKRKGEGVIEDFKDGGVIHNGGR